jgi:membrane protein
MTSHAQAPPLGHAEEAVERDQSAKKPIPPGRGQGASSPTKIPAKGWKDILFRTWSEISDDRVLLIAAGVTYYLLLSIFPTLTAFVSIYGLFTDSGTVATQVALLAGYVPGGFLGIIRDQLTALTQQGNAALGWGFLISFSLALWSSSSGVKTLFEAMNIAYDEREKRNFFVLNGIALAVMLAGLLVGIIMIGVVVILPAALAVIGFAEGFEWLAQSIAYLILAAVLFAILTVLYRIGPSHRKRRLRWLTPGAFFACGTIIAASALFSWYAANFANYEKTYGSLGALIGLLTWLWISVTVVIVGAEINAEIENQTEGHVPVPANTNASRDASGGTVAEPRLGNRAPSRHNGGRKRTVGGLAFAIPAALVLSWFARREAKRQDRA